MKGALSKNALEMTEKEAFCLLSVLMGSLSKIGFKKLREEIKIKK